VRKLAILLVFLYSGLLMAAPALNTTITGISGDALKNAQKRSEKILKLHENVTDSKEIERLFHQISAEIKQSLTPYGYFKAEIRATLIWRNKSWYASYRIIPGPRVKISTVWVRIIGQGRTDPKFQQVLADFPLKQGQPLETPRYNKVKNDLLDMAASRGYFDAEMKQSQVAINIKRNTASINLTLATGRRYKFGEVTFVQKNNGAKRLSYRFLKRFVQFKCGEPYDQKELFKLQEQLVASHYFDQVAITPAPQRSKNLLVPITAELYASKSKRYQFGVGIGTDSGLRGLAGVKFRRLTSDGHYAEFKSKGSYKNNNISGKVNASYNIPGYNPSKDLYKITAEAERDEEDNYGLSQNAKLGFSYITEIKGWQQTLGLLYQVEHSNPIDEDPFSSNLLMPNINWLRVNSDDPIKPNYGYKLALNVRGAGKQALSDTSFIQGWLNAKWITTINDSVRLIARADVGMVGIKNIEDLPLSLRFSAGGTQTVRGYGFKNIKDGRTMSIASIELQHRIYKDIYGAAFF